MNFEKIGYSLIGSLIAGSIIQKNMSLEQQYFFIISAGLWVICIGVQWWNFKREQFIREKLENSNLENRDVIVTKILEIISETSEMEIACIREEIDKLVKGQISLNKDLIENFDKVCDLIKNTNSSIDAFCKTEVTNFVELMSECKKISSDLQTTVSELNKKLIEVAQIDKKIMDTFPSTISEAGNNIILSVGKGASDRQKLIDDRFANTITLLNSIIEVNNSIVENVKAIEKVSVENKDCVCNEITTMKELVDANQRNAITKLGESTDRASKEICSQLNAYSVSVQELIAEKLVFISEQNGKYTSTIEAVVKDVIKQLAMLKDELEASKETVNGSILKEHEIVLNNLTEFMNLLSSINEDTKGIISEKYKDLFGVLSNLQSVLDTTDSRISDIQNTDSNICGLLEDTKNKLIDVESAIGDGTEKIEDAVSQSMERQNEIVTEEQSILDSYNELLGRINDEVIAKLINDSNTLLKCMKDCYNLLDSQRRAKK